VSVDSGGMIGLQQDTFFSKAMSTYKDAVKQLTKFLKKEFKAKPKDVKINLAP
jgi:D-aminopeptidase